MTQSTITKFIKKIAFLLSFHYQSYLCPDFPDERVSKRLINVEMAAILLNSVLIYLLILKVYIALGKN